MNASVAEKQPKGPIVRFLSKLADLVWWLLLIVLVLAALYAGLGRQITQNIDNYRPQIEQLLSERLGHDIRIGSLTSRWSWLNPTIIASDLVVKQEAESDDEVASLQSLRVGLDFLATLARLRIVFSDFDANGLELVINQTPRGDIKVEGADLPEPVADNLSEWIDLAGQWLSDPSVRITRVDLGLRDGNGQLRQVEIPQLDLVYRRGLFHASGRAMRPGTTEQLASFRLVGQHFFRGDFTGQFYGDINSGRLFDGLVQEYPWNNIRAEGFDVGGQVWLTFRDGLMEQVSGTLQTPYLQLGVGQQSLAPLENIQARFGWRRYGQENLDGRKAGFSEPPPWYATGEFHLNDLTWRWNGETVPGFNLRFQAGSDVESLVADRFPVAPIRGFLSALRILPDELSWALNSYKPTGSLDRLLLEMPVDSDGTFQLTANLRDIHVQSHSGTPAAQGLNGSLVVNQEGGLVRADSDTLTFGFPDLFRGLWDVRDFRADVAWRFEDDITRVYSDNIAMRFGPEAELTGAFDLKLVPGNGDVLGLQVGVADGNAGMLADFVPVHLVDSGLYNWLTTAIEEADIPQGTYYGHGQIGGGSPPGSFVSSMVYEFENGTVKYDERWPEVTEAGGSVFVHDGSTRIDLASGQTGGLALRPGQVRVEPGGQEQGPMVYIDAAAPVAADALGYWLDGSPLGELVGDVADSFDVNGDFFLALDLALALDSDRAPDIKAVLRSDSGALGFPQAGLQWTDIAGEIRYSSDSGFSGDPVSARFLDNPVSVRFENSDSFDGVALSQTGKVDVETLRRQSGLGKSAVMGVSGSLDYQAFVEIPTDDAVTIRLLSDLTGVTVDWPEPLGKTPDSRAPLELRIQPDQESDQGQGIGVQVDWQERLNLTVGWRNDRVGVTVNDLHVGERRFQDIVVAAIRGPDNWLLSIDGEWVRGMTTWPLAEDGVVSVDLEKLSMAREEGELEEADMPLEAKDPVQAFRELDFANWPDIDVRVADLQINDQSAGIWSFELRPGANRFEVENILGRLKSLTLTGALGWGIENNEERTGFKGTLNGKSLADLGALVATEIPFRNDRTAVDLDLDWPGRPDQFSAAKLSGSASVRFDEGVILEGNSTAQLFRIFNLLNSDTLWRRLQLDFSDLYEAGVAFDAISGKLRFDDGILKLDPELQIVGPSGAFKFSGTTNMAEETLDMNMVVVIPLTQNLPLAAVLLGAGAPIGGALFVLDKVLGDPLSKLTSASYSVKGSWDKPDVRLRRVFDDGQ